MDEKTKKVLKVTGLVVAGVGIGVGGYFIGKHVGLMLPKGTITYPARTVAFYKGIGKTYPELTERLGDLAWHTYNLVKDNPDKVVSEIIVESGDDLVTFLGRSLATVGITAG